MVMMRLCWSFRAERAGKRVCEPGRVLLAAQVQNMGLAVSRPMARRDGWLGEKVGEEGGTPLQTCTAILERTSLVLDGSHTLRFHLATLATGITWSEVLFQICLYFATGFHLGAGERKKGRKLDRRDSSSNI